MRTTYVYNPLTQRMEQGHSARRGAYSPVYGDLPDFKSPIDGTLVGGRRGMREQFARYGVTNASDYKNEWAKKAADRANMFSGKSFDKRARQEAVRAAYNKLRS